MTILISVRKRLLIKYLTSDFFSIYNSNFNTNGKFDLFYDQIHSVCKKHIPYKRLSKEVKIFSKPWITREILTKMNYRDKLYSKITEKGISRRSDSPLFYLKDNYSGSVFLSSVTSNEIRTCIGKRDANKSSGPYSVPDTTLNY